MEDRQGMSYLNCCFNHGTPSSDLVAVVEYGAELYLINPHTHTHTHFVSNAA